MQNNFGKTTILVFLLLSFLALNGQNVSRRDIRHRPANLEEAVFHLMKILPDSTQQNVLLMSEDEFLANSHFGLGMWIRNNWRLWRGGQLANDFKFRGIFHPDDMSGVILRSYFRELHGLDWKLDEQIKHIQSFWEVSALRQFRLENDTTFARQEKEYVENSIRKRNKERKAEFPIGTQITAWVSYSINANTQIVGEIVDWRVGVRSGGNLGSRREPEIQAEYLEAKVRIVEFMDARRQRRVERRNRVENNELWINGNRIRKIE